MSKVLVPMLLVAGFVALLPSPANARVFRRASRTNNSTWNYNATSSTSTESVTATTVTATTETAASAVTTTASKTTSKSEFDVSTAQGVANLMARYNQVRHFGGNPGYEGCGCGMTREAAYSICCYANSGMRTVDVGYAQGSNGMWYCCRRYR